MGTREAKVVLFGEGAVGKSSLAIRFVKGLFVESYDPTIEDTFRKHINMDNEVVWLEIIDTAGTDQFAIMRDLYIKAGNGFILVFSLISSQTFVEVERYHSQVIHTKEGDSSFVLVGNKSDLVEEREVKKEDAEALAAKLGCSYIETSTKENINVNEAFEVLLRKIVSIEGQSDPKAKTTKLCRLL